MSPSSPVSKPPYAEERMKEYRQNRSRGLAEVRLEVRLRIVDRAASFTWMQPVVPIMRWSFNADSR